MDKLQGLAPWVAQHISSDLCWGVGQRAQVLKHGSADWGTLDSYHLSLVLWLYEEIEYTPLHVLTTEIFQLHSLFLICHSANIYRVLLHAGWFPIPGAREYRGKQARCTLLSWNVQIHAGSRQQTIIHMNRITPVVLCHMRNKKMG